VVVTGSGSGALVTQQLRRKNTPKSGDHVDPITAGSALIALQPVAVIYRQMLLSEFYEAREDTSC
jgi:hypothetical protein